MFKLDPKQTGASRVMNVLRVLLAAALVALAVPAFAFHFPWDQGHDTTRSNDPPPPGPDDRPPCDDDCKGGASGSPVYAALGHAIWRSTDVVLRGRPYIGVYRVYNSNDPVVGLFGNGWSVDFDVALYPANTSGTPERIYKAPNGKRIVFVKQADGSFKAPDSRFETVVEGASSVTMTTLDGKRNVFGLDGRLLERVDPNGNRVVFSYDASLRPVRIDDGRGRFLAIAYNSASLVGSIADHTGRTWRYGYDASANLTSVTDPAGGVLRYTWQGYRPPGDAVTYSQLLSVTDPSGVSLVTFTYSGNQVSSYTEGADRFTYTRPSANTKLAGTVTKRNALNVATSYSYGALGLITREVDGLGGTTNFTFDANGNVTQRVDALGRTWTTTYDALGRETSNTNPLGQRTATSYQGSNPRPTLIVSPSGRTTSMAYDGRHNLVALTDPSGATTRFTYNSTGDVVQTQNALNQTQTIEYNAFGLPTRVVDPLGRATLIAYDALGRPTTVTTPGGQATQYRYDLLDRVTAIVDALNQTTSYTYDASGRVAGVTDPKGSVTTFEYDAFGRRTAEMATDGRRKQYAYRLDNKIDRIVWPDATTLVYQYDNNRRLIREAAGTDITTYSYDALNRLTSASGPGGSIGYAYDGAGRVSSSTSNSQTVAITRNAEGERTRVDALAQSLVYARDARGSVTRLTAGTGNFDFGYDALRRRQQLTYPNGASTQHAFDAAGQVSGITHSGAFTAALAYQYDAAGRMTRLSGDGSNWSYSYDALGRLVRADHGVQSFQYTLDAAGNVLDGERAYDGNHRLIADAAKTYAYDLRGNLVLETDKTSGARVVHTWNARNELLRQETFADAVATTPTRTLSFTYDPIGRRVSKTDNGVTVRYTYDGLNQIGVHNAANGVLAVQTFGSGLDEPLSRSGTDGTRFYHANHLGSVIALSDATTTRTTYGYSPYGRVQASGEASSNALTFTGRESDSDNLLFFRSRYYSPSRQQFLSPDTFGTGRSLNRYGYANANPIRFVDPLGTTGQDKWYGYNDKGFRDWVHGQKQQEGRGASENYGKDELKDLWDQWNEEGRPRGKGGKSGKGGKGRGGDQCEPEDEPAPEPAPETSPDPEPSSNDNTALYVGLGILLVIGIGAAIVVSGGTAAPALAFASDRHIKENLSDIDPHTILKGLMALPVTAWNYRAEGSSVRHIGPMAQDFKATFSVGARDTEISIVDANGVLVASVQALKHELDAKSRQIEQLQTQLQQCLAGIERLERRLGQGRDGAA